jgi:hypothetical protein
MEKTTHIFASALFVLVLLFAMFSANAEPEGASVVNVSATQKNATTPDSRQDPKGSITTVQLTTTQQNIRWKAYVGNVSGTLVLRDADDYAIYEWPSGGSPSGRVFLTMNDTVDWSTIRCANSTGISPFQTALGHGANAMDNVNNTFSSALHMGFSVGEIPIAQSTCPTTYTWVNDTAQTPSTSALFQELLLMDNAYKIVFTTIMNQDTTGYDNQSTYDFQAIVPDYTGAAIARYYFYVEIEG